MTGDGAPPEQTRPGRLLRVAMFLAPSGLIAGIAYYFGYVSTRAYFAYFGVPLSALDLAPNDLYIDATDSFFLPVAAGALLGMVALVLHLAIKNAPLAAHPAAVRRALAAAALVSVGLAVLGMFALLPGLRSVLNPGPFAGAAALAGAAVLVEYAIWVALRARALSPALERVITSGAELRRGLVFVIVAVAVFWATANMAHASGIDRARSVESTLAAQAAVVVYASGPLYLDGTGIIESRVSDASSEPVYRYDGLRTLAFARDSWYLLPAGWTHRGNETAIILPEQPGEVRVELLPPVD